MKLAAFTPIQPSYFAIGRGFCRAASLPKTVAYATAIGTGPRMSANDARSPIRLAPSDFAFLWEECRRCFYLKAHKKLYRPRAPFPSIFGTIDLSMKRHLRGLRTTDVIPSMPPGVFLCEDHDAWVECKPITPPGHSRALYVRGMLDCLVRYDDGSFGVIDFKTSSVEHSSSTYSRQLHAYARAIEFPSSGSELIQGKVSSLGLVVFEPNEFSALSPAGAAMTGQLKYVDVPRDDDGFISFLGKILDVLNLDEPPPPASPKGKKSWGDTVTSCPYCQFLHDAQTKSLNYNKA